MRKYGLYDATRGLTLALAADIDAAFGDVAGGAGVHGGRVEGEGLAGQRHFDGLVRTLRLLRLHRRHLIDQLVVRGIGAVGLCEVADRPHHDQHCDHGAHDEEIAPARRRWWRRMILPVVVRLVVGEKCKQ